MADAVQFANQVQEAARSVYEAIQETAGIQVNTLQRLGEIQQGLFSQAVDATNDELQLVSRVRGPQEFISAQAELVKSHGQRYADSVKRTMDIMVEAWQEYGDRLEKTINAATDTAQHTSKKAA